MKTKIKCSIYLFFLFLSLSSWGQEKKSITLDECYRQAIEHSTINRQQQLRQSIATSETKESNSAYIPSLSLNGLASYQSDVTSVPIAIVKPPRKEQYRATLDLEQLIYDGGATSRRKGIITSGLDAEQLKLNISELELKDRVASFYLGINLLGKNEKIINLHIDVLKRNLTKLENRQKYGIAAKGNIVLLEAELLKAQQRLIEIRSDKKKIVGMLSVLMGIPLSTDMNFILPNYEVETYTSSKRPEYRLFEAQKRLMDGQIKLADSKNLPKVALFATGGNGLPGLNMLNRTPDWYYIAGLRLSVPLTKWTTTKHEKNKYSSQKSIIESQKSDYARNNQMQIVASRNEIEKLKFLIESDTEIIAKRKEIAGIEQEKLLNGVATSNDYITELNAYKEVLLTQKLNEIKLIQAIINYKSITGNN